MNKNTRYFMIVVALIMLLTVISTQSIAEENQEKCLSNYAYVSVKSVYFREAPGSNRKSVGTINKYGLLELFETHMVDGDLWYHIDFNGKNGYIKEGYFTQLTVEEAKDFINSEYFTQGLENNNIAKWGNDVNITVYIDAQQTSSSETQTNIPNGNKANKDYSQMTTDDLLSEYSRIRNEVFARTLTYNNGEVLLVDQDDVKLYLTGTHEISKAYDGSDTISFAAVVINNLDYEIRVEPSASINGWDVQCFSFINTSAGNKKKGEIKLSLVDANISSYEEISDIEFRIYISGVGQMKPIHVSFTAQ